MMRTVLGGLALLLVISLVPCVYAGSDIGLYGIGGKLGFVDPEGGIGSTFGLGVHADMGTLTGNIHLGGFIDYWSKSYDELGMDASFSDIVLGATAKYFFKMNSKMEPYVGAGMGLAMGRGKVEFENPYTGGNDSESNTEIDMGPHFLGGVEFPISPNMKGFGEMKFHINFGDNAADYWGLFGGVMFSLGK